MLRKFLSGLLLTVLGIGNLFGQTETTLLGTPLTRSEIYNYDLSSDSAAIAALDSLAIQSTVESIVAKALQPAASAAAVGSKKDKSLTDSKKDATAPDSIIARILPTDSLIKTMDVVTTPIPAHYFRPVVFDSFQLLDSIRLPKKDIDLSLNDSIYGWLVSENYHSRLISRAKQSFIVNMPADVRFDEASLPEPPREFKATVDPETAKIVIDELPSKATPQTQLEASFNRRHWLKTFNSSIQFSQAYVSPNWYQGGNNNLNVLVNLYYNIKLNPAFHKNMLFETTFQYKLGMNDAPNDSLRSYSISEDLFQFNLLAGYKASKYWYYSTNVSFKTQLMRNFKSNTHDLKGAFLSPGELNVGIGMTFNYSNPKKTFTMDASISPLSWNMKTCISHKMNEESFGITKGRKTVDQYGSNAEGKAQWKLCENISLRSRLFVFTDYKYAYGDWENTFSFTINRYLSTQIYVHMRYDTSTPACDDPDWSKFQLKEILSFGFSYKISSI